MKKSVKLSITHDRLSLSATYPTGGTFRFTIGRSGERLAWGGSIDPTVAKEQMKVFMSAAKCRAGETNAIRMERLKNAAERAESASSLISILGS